MAKYFPDTNTGFERYPYLKGAHKSLIRLLLTYRNSRTGECCPTQKTLAECLGAERKTVGTWIEQLYEYGVLFYCDVLNGRSNGGVKRMYVLNLEWINSLDLKPDKHLNEKLRAIPLPYSHEWVKLELEPPTQGGVSQTQGCVSQTQGCDSQTQGCDSQIQGVYENLPRGCTKTSHKLIRI